MLAFLGFGLVATYTGLVKSVLIGFLHAHMGIVAVDAREIDVGIVLVEIALVGTFETSAHLESLRMSGHHECCIALVGWHVNSENRIKVHSWTKIREFLSGFEYVIALQVAALTNVYLQFPGQSFGVYNRPIGLFAGIHNHSIRFFLNMKGAWAMAAFTVNAEREFFEDVDRAVFGFWHSRMTAHAFDINFPVETGIEFFIAWR